MVLRTFAIVPMVLLLATQAGAQTTAPPDSPDETPEAEPEMIRVDGGRREVGTLLWSISDNPVREVCLAPFYMGRHEVTFLEYDRFARATGRRLPHDLDWGRSDRPVVDVTREDAEAYARWLGEQTGHHYRLPTEDEWEVAARGSDSPVSQYSAAQQAEEVRANCADCDSPWGGESTAPVGRFPANSLGLHDMHGNVWEWTASCYRDVAEGCNVGVIRGGSWDSGTGTLRFSHRGTLSLRSRSGDVGFRLLREVLDAAESCEAGA